MTSIRTSRQGSVSSSTRRTLHKFLSHGMGLFPFFPHLSLRMFFHQDTKKVCILTFSKIPSRSSSSVSESFAAFLLDFPFNGVDLDLRAILVSFRSVFFAALAFFAAFAAADEVACFLAMSAYVNILFSSLLKRRDASSQSLLQSTGFHSSSNRIPTSERIVIGSHNLCVSIDLISHFPHSLVLDLNSSRHRTMIDFRNEAAQRYATL
jgi:hypothetical protein